MKDDSEDIIASLSWSEPYRRTVVLKSNAHIELRRQTGFERFSGDWGAWRLVERRFRHSNAARRRLN